MSISQVVNFNESANVSIRRSKFKIPSRHLTSFNAGDLVPIYLQEVLPGDTFKMDSSMLVRSTTPLHPTMDNAYLDIFFFFVPSRLVWDNWARFNGESDKAWVQDTTYTIPQLVMEVGDAVEPGSVLDYFGVCPKNGQEVSYEFKVNALPFRSYQKIWNDWFRDENLQDAIDINTGDTDDLSYDFNGFNFLNPDGNLRVCKYHDYFTSALPKPQKGADVLIPASGAAPIYTMPLNNTVYGSSVQPHFTNFKTFGEKFDPLTHPDSATGGGTALNGEISTTTNPKPGTTIIGSATYTGMYDPGSSLYANLNAIDITVNNLRLAVQTQKLLEKDARGGTRYTEILRSHFGIVSPDARLQRSEYLGGKHIPINMAEIAQTSASAGDNYLGNLAGYSSTTSKLAT